MNDVLSIVGPIVIVALMVFRGAAIAKGGFTMWRTPADDDTVTNRLLGQGPAQEVLRPSPYDRMRDRLRARRRRWLGRGASGRCRANRSRPASPGG